MASNIAEKLRYLKFVVYFLPMDDRESDDVVNFVRKNLSNADAVIAVPGQSLESFSNSEILRAASLNKPVALIVDANTRALPYTALSGYPVFLLGENIDTGLRSIAMFCYYLFGHYKSCPMIWKQSVDKALPVFLVVLAPFGVFFYLAIRALFIWWNPIVLLSWMERANWTLLFGEVVSLFIGLSMATYAQWTSRRTVMQQTEKRRFSYSVLKDAMGGTDEGTLVLGSLVAEPLSILKV
jgi:hypothetical protein